MLEKTDELAKHRLKVAEMMLTQISEEMRQQRRIKEQTFKRVSGGGGEGGREEDDECISQSLYLSLFSALKWLRR